MYHLARDPGVHCHFQLAWGATSTKAKEDALQKDTEVPTGREASRTPEGNGKERTQADEKETDPGDANQGFQRKVAYNPPRGSEGICLFQEAWGHRKGDTAPEAEAVQAVHPLAAGLHLELERGDWLVLQYIELCGGHP